MKIGVRIVSLLAISITGAFLLLLLHQYRQWTERNIRPAGHFTESCSLDDNHWIDDMIRDAEWKSEHFLEADPTSLAIAAAAYRVRRGRHPPPGFDVWFAWGKKHHRVMVEEFFDQIYEDLEPYWGVSPQNIRDSVDSWPSDVLRIRNGKVLDFNKERFRTRTWAMMLKEISPFLPDVDLAVNALDEPRILVSKDVMDGHLQDASKQKIRMMSIPTSQISPTFQRRKMEQSSAPKARMDVTNVDSYHAALKASCGDSHPTINNPSSIKTNTTVAQDICANPHLTSQHGFLIEPATIHFSTSLIPVFSASKTSINNDILLPEPAYYYDQFHLFSSQDFWSYFRSPIPWPHKTHALIWRGGATGGIPRPTTWSHFHRHRFVTAMNATTTTTDKPPEISPEWLHQISNVAFTSLSCNPHLSTPETCNALTQHFHLESHLPMHQQFTHKYLPDIDGNTLSGRFREFLLSTSAPLKSTIFKEWHDHRLLAWKHYIPVSIALGEEIYEILRFFLGDERVCANDAAGERIAGSGKGWAERVLGREDMLLYLWRVVLEFARVGEEERDLVGFVGDLL